MRILLLVTLLVFGLHGHTKEYDIGRDSKQRKEPLKLGKVLEGKIIQVRNVTVEPTSTAKRTGRAIGAATGAAGARALRKKGILIPALGGLIGGVVGNSVTDSLKRVTAQELLVVMENGDFVELTQAESDLRPGQEVYVIRSRGKTRVILKGV